MFSKFIVILQGIIVLLLGVLLVAQARVTPDEATPGKDSSTRRFMHPWRPGNQSPPPAASDMQASSSVADNSAPSKSATTTTASSAPASATITAKPEPTASGSPTAPVGDKTSPSGTERYYILAPAPVLDAVVTKLENKDLEAVGPVLIPAEPIPMPPPSPPAKVDRPRRHKTQPAPALIEITGLTVTPTADGARLRVETTAQPQRMVLRTFNSPPRLVLELHGPFAAFNGSVAIPPNPIFKNLGTELSPGMLRIVGDLLTPNAYVVPLSTAGRNFITLGMTLNPANQPNYLTQP